MTYVTIFLGCVAGTGLVVLLFFGAVKVAQMSTRKGWNDPLHGLSQRPVEPTPAWLLAAYDDGTSIYLSSHAGGAAPEGAWGTLGLMRTEANGRAMFRRFTADGPWTPSDITHMWIDEAGDISPEMVRKIMTRRDPDVRAPR